ncbi:DMT family transporter [Dankookia rubra]|uniref:DMT family transporter n=1 Tax=Dankookia rubra TaxID=1442381 RepID=A0A4R5QER1_9PROT|nr:DMT family transporter [Dankookia rubra]TDH61001.1 DMT family transporter [Dankookia rubra]
MLLQAGRGAAAPGPVAAARRPRPTYSTALLLAAAVLLFGASWPAVKVAILGTGATSIWLTASRSGLAALALMLLLLSAGRLSRPARPDLPALLAIGVLQLTVFFLLCSYAVRFVPAGHTAILSNAAIIWVVPLAALLRQREPPARWIAAALTLAGVAIIIDPWSISAANGAAAWGHALLLAAALAWACTILVTKAWPPRLHVILLLPWAFALSAALLVGLAILLEPDGGIPPAAWPLAAFNGLVVAPFGTGCIIELSRRLTPTAAAISFMIIPVVGVLISTVMLGEAIDAALLCGGALILGGAALTAAR